MNILFNLLIFALISSITVSAQEVCPAVLIEAENITLAENIFINNAKEAKLLNGSYVCKIAEKMSDERFMALSDRFQHNPYFKRTQDMTKEEITAYIMYAENFSGQFNVFIALQSYFKELEYLPEDVQTRLRIIDNTIQMYTDIQQALDLELQYNTGEIIDNGIALLIKQVPEILPSVNIPGYTSIDTELANMLGKDVIAIKYNHLRSSVRKTLPIENNFSDQYNKAFTYYQRIAMAVPPLRLITKAPLYRLFEGLPEISKNGAHVAVNLQVYFRKSEITDLISQLQREKSLIISNFTSGY